MKRTKIDKILDNLQGSLIPEYIDEAKQALLKEVLGCLPKKEHPEMSDALADDKLMWEYGHDKAIDKVTNNLHKLFGVER